jgi:ATP-dependent Clp protease, protease subunit
MMKTYLKACVQDGKDRLDHVAVECFRLDAADESGGLTAEEAEAAAESEAEPATTAVMRIYEDIGEDPFSGSGLSEKQFAKELYAFGDIRRLNIHINSLGGCAFTAHAIHSIIEDHPAQSKTAYVDGVAASAATIIACGANEVVARHNTTYMIHEPWTSFVRGNADTLREAADILDKLTVPIVRVYKDQVKGKTSEEDIRQMMKAETWMTADEALAHGFVDRVRGKISAIARVGKDGRIMCSGRLMDLARYHYRNAPKWPTKRLAPPPPADFEVEATAQARPQPEQKEKKPMTKEEIAPELLASIQAEARTVERARLDALDAMAGPGLTEIIAKAKTEGKQPGDIALECLSVTKQQLNASRTSSALARDAAGARGLPAGDAPAGKLAPEKPEARGARLIAAACKAIKPRGLVPSLNGHRN